MLIRVTPVVSIVSGEQGYYATLNELNGSRRLVMEMDSMSASCMLSALQKDKMPAAPAAQAIITCVQALHASIEKLVVHSLREGRFLSILQIRDRRSGRSHSIDVNVIDGIITAIFGEFPIFTTEEVFKNNDEELERMGRDFFSSQAQQNFNCLDPKKDKKM